MDEWVGWLAGFILTSSRKLSPTPTNGSQLSTYSGDISSMNLIYITSSLFPWHKIKGKEKNLGGGVCFLAFPFNE